YVETTIVSYLTAWPSPDKIMAGNQRITRNWWREHRKNFELCISLSVLNEAAAGDKKAATRRMRLLRDLKVLETTPDARTLASGFLLAGSLPKTAAEDAIHVAVAAINGVNFLLTWNCKHIANALLMDQIEMVCNDFGVRCPRICTPNELMGGTTHV